MWGGIIRDVGRSGRVIIRLGVDTSNLILEPSGVSLTITQKPNLNGFIKPGELVNIREGAGLSLHDRRVFNILIENAWTEIGEDKQHSISLSKLRGTRHKGALIVKESVRALMTTLVEVPTMLDGEEAIFATQLLGPTTRTIDEDSPNAVLLYKFPVELRKIIQDSKYWARIKSHVMFSFSSKYALALYEALCLRINLRVQEQTFSVDDFRALLGIEPGKLVEPFNLKKWALDIAVTEVNALSDFNVEIHPIREGGMQRGKLTGFRLWWERKEPEDWQDALDEIMRPKVGRKARIKGTVERVA